MIFKYVQSILNTAYIITHTLQQLQILLLFIGRC